MKKTILLVFCLILSSLLTPAQHKEKPRAVSSLVDVGGRRLHFTIIKGEGLPILFEAGGGDDAAVWNNILESVADITGATLITYDRAGFGKSEIDTKVTDIGEHGIINGIEELETGLKKLGYDGKIMLVAHSYGGFYATLYASRHPKHVQAVVLIDANHACFFTDEYVNNMMQDMKEEIAKVQVDHPGKYYQFINFPNTVEIMKRTAFPATIPAIDLVSDYPPFQNTADIARWKTCHQQFADAASNRERIIAYGTGHYIFKDNPPLVVNAIVKAYSEIVGKNRRDEILKRGISYAVKSANETRKQELAYWHSEEDMDSWGYSLLKRGELQKALDIFKLNVTLYPDSWKVYASYGETLLKAGRKEEAIKMYQKSIEMNPQNEKGKKVLEQLNK